MSPIGVWKKTTVGPNFLHVHDHEETSRKKLSKPGNCDGCGDMRGVDLSLT